MVSALTQINKTHQKNKSASQERTINNKHLPHRAPSVDLSGDAPFPSKLGTHHFRHPTIAEMHFRCRIGRTRWLTDTPKLSKSSLQSSSLWVSSRLQEVPLLLARPPEGSPEGPHQDLVLHAAELLISNPPVSVGTTSLQNQVLVCASRCAARLHCSRKNIAKSVSLL